MDVKPSISDLCQPKLPDREDLGKPNPSSTDVKNRVLEDICKKENSTDSVISQHVVFSSDGTIFVGNMCGKEFSHTGSLVSLLDPPTTKEKPFTTKEKPFVCEICRRHFATKTLYQEHIPVHGVGQQFPCDKCPKRFTRKRNLRSHQEKYCKGTKPAETTAPARKLRPKRRYVCELCSKAFASKDYLQIHHRIHSGEKPFACALCRKCFSDRSSLTNHVRTHTGDKRFACNECGKCFYQKHDLAKHLRVHSGERPYACELCQKRFSQKVHLKIHLRIHTGEKPYLCDLCPKRFSLMDSLNKHQRSHARKMAAANQIKEEATSTP